MEDHSRQRTRPSRRHDSALWMYDRKKNKDHPNSKERRELRPLVGLPWGVKNKGRSGRPKQGPADTASLLQQSGILTFAEVPVEQVERVLRYIASHRDTICDARSSEHDQFQAP